MEFARLRPAPPVSDTALDSRFQLHENYRFGLAPAPTIQLKEAEADTERPCWRGEPAPKVELPAIVFGAAAQRQYSEPCAGLGGCAFEELVTFELSKGNFEEAVG